MRPLVELDRAAIEARLPHREPFLFLDRARLDGDAGAPDAALTAEWRVPEDAGFFRGHYPGNPITPGVILCEHACQAAAVLLCARGQRFSAARDVPVLARIDEARFRRMVRSGETLSTRVTLVDIVGPAAVLEARASVGSELALKLRCVLARAERTER